MCYSGEWFKGYGIEPVFSKSFEMQNLLRHEKFWPNSAWGQKEKNLDG